MANQQHLELLKGGTEAWNQWRSAHQTTIPDFSKADLERLNLSNADLRGANFTAANLRRAKLQNAYLSSADFRGAYL